MRYDGADERLSRKHATHFYLPPLWGKVPARCEAAYLRAEGGYLSGERSVNTAPHIQEVELGGDKSFVGAWFLSDLKICDELIRYFHAKEGKVEGEIGHNRTVNKDIKDSLDLYIPPEHFSHPIVAKYLRLLREVAAAYGEKYQAAVAVQPWGITENINIQYYKPAGGYKEWHTERIGRMLPSANRHLAFMTYLNDVHDEGGTEFYYQRLRSPARKGLTLIWPVDWTHLHRGVVSPTEEKYIITGWFSFL